MEFVSSEASTTLLAEQHEMLRDACEKLGIVLPPNSTAIPPEVEQALHRHIERRKQAFTAVPHDMKKYRGDPLTYVDPWLVSRMTGASLTESEVDSNALFAKYSDRVEFGASMKRTHFHLLPSQHFLNTGSYGATPRAVLDARAAWELLEMADPYTFRTSILPFRLRSVINRLAVFIGAHPADVQLMINANTATSTVFKSMPWEAGDALLLLSCDYDATKLAATYLFEMYGVEPVYVDVVLPLKDDEIVKALNDFLKLRLANHLPMPKLANFCHVTSKTAWIFPVARMVDVCHRFGIPVVIDGAQAPGHIPINVVDIGADWYIGTCHKWMFACQGVAFLVTAPSKHDITKPLAPITPPDEPYGSAFIGASTEDYSTLLALAQALDFVDQVCGGWANVWRYNAALAQAAVAELTTMWKLEQEGLECVNVSQVLHRRDRPGEVNCMPIVPLPNSRGATEASAKRAMGYLLTRCDITAFLLVERFRDANGDVYEMLAVRLTCQIHVGLEDVRALGQAVLNMVARDDLGGEGSAEEGEQIAVA
jgi:isopenicillin-N epimerase